MISGQILEKTENITDHLLENNRKGINSYFSELVNKQSTDDLEPAFTLVEDVNDQVSNFFLDQGFFGTHVPTVIISDKRKAQGIQSVR